jgi:hypothetical protein
VEGLRTANESFVEAGIRILELSRKHAPAVREANRRGEVKASGLRFVHLPVEGGAPYPVLETAVRYVGTIELCKFNKGQGESTRRGAK